MDSGGWTRVKIGNTSLMMLGVLVEVVRAVGGELPLWQDDESQYLGHAVIYPHWETDVVMF